MNIKAIICFAVVLGLHSRAIGSTNISLYVQAALTVGTNYNYTTNTLNLSTGQVAKLIYANFTSSTYGDVRMRVAVMGVSFSVTDSQINASVRPLAFVGPASINLVADAGGAGFCAIELSDPSDSFLPSNAVVIPADSGGPVNIILESSADLINWYPSLPGAYGANYTNRFFRVRAQRSQ